MVIFQFATLTCWWDLVGQRDSFICRVFIAWTCSHIHIFTYTFCYYPMQEVEVRHAQIPMLAPSRSLDFSIWKPGIFHGPTKHGFRSFHFRFSQQDQSTMIQMWVESPFTNYHDWHIQPSIQTPPGFFQGQKPILLPGRDDSGWDSCGRQFRPPAKRWSHRFFVWDPPLDQYFW